MVSPTEVILNGKGLGTTTLIRQVRQFGIDRCQRRLDFRKSCLEMCGDVEVRRGCFENRRVAQRDRPELERRQQVGLRRHGRLGPAALDGWRAHHPPVQHLHAADASQDAGRHVDREPGAGGPVVRDDHLDVVDDEQRFQVVH